MLFVKDVHFAYDDKKEILCSINLTIHSGDYVALIGGNGSGKTTLMKVILGFLKPQIGGVNLNTHYIGYVPQGGLIQVSSFPASVLEVVTMRRPRMGIIQAYKRENRVKALDALSKVGMDVYADYRISELSGGQLQRVLIARELINQPEFLLLDEPTTGLDSESIVQMFNVLKELNDQGMTILVINHDIEEVMPYVNRIVKLSNHHLYEVEK